MLLLLTKDRWYWWADVPVKKHAHVFALPVTTYQGEPTIEYRGIFINDEAPSLTSWVNEKFGPVYNSEFYKKVFELLLRMKVRHLEQDCDLVVANLMLGKFPMARHVVWQPRLFLFHR